MKSGQIILIAAAACFVAFSASAQPDMAPMKPKMMHHHHMMYHHHHHHMMMKKPMMDKKPM